jgi:hypothetical protein
LRCHLRLRLRRFGNPAPAHTNNNTLAEASLLAEVLRRGLALDLLVLPFQLGGASIVGYNRNGRIYDRPWIAMNAAHVRAEAAISTRNGLTVPPYHIFLVERLAFKSVQFEG